jgi:hypothetical protein
LLIPLTAVAKPPGVVEAIVPRIEAILAEVELAMPSSCVPSPLLVNENSVPGRLKVPA